MSNASDEMPPPLVAAKALLDFTAEDKFLVDTPLRQIVLATFWRSEETFRAVCMLLEQGFPRQAAMLNRPLFEDLLVAHWLVLNRDDSEWLEQRFFRHRDAIALHQERLSSRTGWKMGEPLADGSKLRRRQNELTKEFGGEAQRNWWDPCENGDGTGEPLGLRGIAQRLEQAAAEHRMFYPRFAGGQEPLLERWELVVHKWFTQFLHHTALGLEFAPSSGDGPPEMVADPSDMVIFAGVWMYAQETYLLHDLYERDTAKFDELLAAVWIEGFGASPDDFVYAR
jgi:hypothetical protein